MVEFSRKVTPLKVLKSGAEVGSIRRSADGRHYILELKGVYWRQGIKSFVGGPSSIWFKHLSEAKSCATTNA